ncbi:MAG: Uma2 family endonuclease [Isosphaeraceae bacterium]
MATVVDPTIAPDRLADFEIRPGTLLQYLETRPETGPRIKCLEGSVTLVSPGRSHESQTSRLDRLIAAVCLELGIEHAALASTTWTLPDGADDTAYEADLAYYVQNFGKEKPDQPPDLAVEVVVSHPEKKALRAGEVLKIPEMWVYDVPRRRLTFHHRTARGKYRGVYRPGPRSRAFPFLTAAEVAERLDDPAPGETAFFRNCQEWSRRVLRPRLQFGD